MKKILIIFFSFIIPGVLVAQETFPVNGVADNNHVYDAFTNAIIFVDFQTKLDKATLLIKDGKIVGVGKDIKIPAGTVIHNLNGKFIYPSIIDIYSNYGVPEVKKERKVIPRPQIERESKGAFGWNEAVKPEINAVDLFSNDGKKSDELRKLGFGAVLTSQMDGIARGTGAVVLLGDESENKMIVSGKAAALYSFNKGSSNQDYPSSLMGSIALLRQTYLDARWYKSNSGKEEYNLSLDAFNKAQSIPQIFEVNDWQSLLRADKIGDEFGVQYIIKGGGDEYQRIDAIKNSNAKLIVPLDFPEAYDVEDPYDANLVSYTQLKNWELAPANPALLEKNSIDFVFTSFDLKKKTDYWKNLRDAVENGLSEKTALKSITYNPALFLGLQGQLGSLAEGKIANFIITSDGLFDKKNIIYENWVNGRPYQVNDVNVVNLNGNYNLSVGNKSYSFVIDGEINKPSGTIKINDTTKIKVKVSVSRKLVTLSFDLKDKNGVIRLSGNISQDPLELSGQGQAGNGEWINWNAKYISETSKKDIVEKKKEKQEMGDVIYPFEAFGKKEIPGNAKNVLIKNATIWTNEKEGVLKNADLYLKNGKIEAIGKDLKIEGSNFEVIDGTGKQVTSGIIDEHSHIAISNGVNENAQASTSEVRIGDVINSEDINIYRQLSGGVVASQLLHGSANPIGGQSGIIKLRWGKTPEEMKIKGADGFIKFALGENVKQSNWGSYNTVRFPQTRMGVEQVYVDAFTRAQEYGNEWEKYTSLSKADKLKTDKPRKDLELDALVEILNQQRFITCHSYEQSEINMLMKVAESFHFRINTFTHILEGYKVADKMKEHGAGGSTFSDWWAYKFEVNDAIPYNGAIMHDEGIIVAYNSDDAEMGRRLNQEAAKGVKYGGVSQEEALKFVTLNPAKLLHLDNRMGSIKTGKDADVVVWSGNPLSIYSKVEKTFVDGVKYFDWEEDIKMSEVINKERTRIIQKMISEKKSGTEVKKPAMEKEILYNCETMLNNYMENE